MSKSIKKFISVFIIIQFVIFIPSMVEASIPWETKEPIGASLISDPVGEHFYFVNDTIANCNFGPTRSKVPIAPCLCDWHEDTKGALVTRGSDALIFFFSCHSGLMGWSSQTGYSVGEKVLLVRDAKQNSGAFGSLIMLLIWCEKLLT